MRVCCVICGELFLLNQDVSATPCGHTFHNHCILQWLERSKSCPQCRNKATQKTLKRLYFDASCVDGETDPEALEQQLDNMKFQMKLMETELNKVKEQNEVLTVQAVALREEFKSCEESVRDKDTTILALKTQLQYVDRMKAEAQKATREAKELREQLQLLKGVEKLLKETDSDVDYVLKSQSNSEEGRKTLVTFCSVLKRELTKTTEDKMKLKLEAKNAMKKCKAAIEISKKQQEDLDCKTNTVSILHQETEMLQEENSKLKKKISVLEQAISSPSDDVRSSAIHRLLSESPAPDILTRLHSANADDFVTPEVVRQRPKRPQHHIATEQEKDDIEIIDINLPARKKPRSTTQPLIDSVNTMKWKSTHKFAKTTTPALGPDKKLEGKNVGYDGLGGHHKVDDFPKPRPLFPISKKASYRPAPARKRTTVLSKKGIRNPNMMDYFKNTFED